MGAKNTARTMQERFPKNVPDNIYDAWKLSQKVGDIGKIMKALRLSRPVVDRALKYGHVKKGKLTNDITKFFQNRINTETITAKSVVVKRKVA